MWPKRRSHAPDSSSDSSCATPRATMFGSRSVKPDIPAGTFGSRYASCRRQKAPRNPSLQSCGMAIRSTLQSPRWCSISTMEDTGLDRARRSPEIHLGEPEIAKFGRLDGQDHEAIRHSLHFVETAAPIGPVVQREHRERGIKCLRSEGESLSRRLDYKRCLTRSLPDHVPRWFNGYQEPADRFEAPAPAPTLTTESASPSASRIAAPILGLGCRGRMCTSVQSGRYPA